ncbi:MAG: hypothetical protein K5929_00195, partial [Lachnospiraceae bacterium]|nr:hypothetical protein [Lachnospiraceae bacterium]
MSNRDDNSGERPKLRLVKDDEDIEETGGIGSEPDEDDIRVDIISADEDEPQDPGTDSEGDAEEPDEEEYGSDDPEEREEDYPEEHYPDEDEPVDPDGSDEDYDQDTADEDDEDGDPEDDPDLVKYKKRMAKLKSRRVQKILDIVLYSILGLDLVVALIFVLGFTGVIKFKNANGTPTSEDVISAMKDDNGEETEKAETKPKKEKKDKEEITFTISATGDCTFGNAQVHTYENSFCEYYDKYGAD